MTAKVLTVTQITEYIRVTLDQDSLLSGVAIKGEISNYKLYPSGHHYFTLKDENSSIKCVMFRANGMRLRFRPENGMKIIAMGKISVFPRDGVYQLYCTALTPDGAGDLHIAFEQLKKKLGEEGLFDPSHKKTIPQFPGTIAIITSSAGAAIHDMLRILRKRYPLTKVKLLPVRVQGQEAPGEIVKAIEFVNQNNIADLIITGRGGGSIEDLWAFNDEGVARAIYASSIPVISAVGHEPDVTISDYVADLRAATPSNAAELAVPDQQTILQNLDSLYRSIYHGFSGQLKARRRHFDILSSSVLLQDPLQYIEKHRQQLSAVKDRLEMHYARKLHLKKQKYVSLTAKLDAMSPLKVISRGYSMVTDANGELIRSFRQVCAEDEVDITLSEGCVHARVLEVKEDPF